MSAGNLSGLPSHLWDLRDQVQEWTDQSASHDPQDRRAPHLTRLYQLPMPDLLWVLSKVSRTDWKLKP